MSYVLEGFSVCNKECVGKKKKKKECVGIGQRGPVLD